MKVRLHFLAQELQRFHDALMRDLCAAIHLAQNPVEAERLLQPHQAIRHPLGRADDELVAQGFVIGFVCSRPPRAARSSTAALAGVGARDRPDAAPAAGAYASYQYGRGRNSG